MKGTRILLGVKYIVVKRIICQQRKRVSQIWNYGRNNTTEWFTSHSYKCNVTYNDVASAAKENINARRFRWEKYAVPSAEQLKCQRLHLHQDPTAECSKNRRLRLCSVDNIVCNSRVEQISVNVFDVVVICRVCLSGHPVKVNKIAHAFLYSRLWVYSEEWSSFWRYIKLYFSCYIFAIVPCSTKYSKLLFWLTRRKTTSLQVLVEVPTCRRAVITYPSNYHCSTSECI